MKKKIAVALAMMAAAVTFNNASAQTPVSWVAGDIILGFNADTGSTGAGTNVVFNLGLASNLGAVSANLGGDLSNVYGTNWYSRTDLTWGVFGADDNKNIWASVASGGTAWKSLGNGNATPKANLYNAGSEYNAKIAVNSFDTNTPVGVFEPISDTYSWNSENPSGNAFGFSVSSILNNGNIVAVPATNLDIYSMNTTRNSVGTLAATLTLSSTGTVSAVPEPSTYALFGFGALLLVVAARRKNA
jgi:hypothetical protein